MDPGIKRDEQIKRQQDNGGRDNEEDRFVFGARANHFVSRCSRGSAELESDESPLFLSLIARAWREKGRQVDRPAARLEGKEMWEQSDHNQKERQRRSNDHRQPGGEVE